jgi:hypothetical protein
MNEMRKLMETIEEGMFGDMMSDVGNAFSGRVSNKANIIRNARMQLKEMIALAESGLDAGSEDMLHEALTEVLQRTKDLEEWLRTYGNKE